MEHNLIDSIPEEIEIKIMDPGFLNNLSKKMKIKVFFTFILSLSIFIVGFFTNFSVKADERLGSLIKNINNSKIFFIKLVDSENISSPLVLKNYINKLYYDLDISLSKVFNIQNLTYDTTNLTFEFNNLTYSKTKENDFTVKCWDGFYFNSSCPFNKFSNSFTKSIPLIRVDYVSYSDIKNKTFIYYEEKVIVKESCLAFNTNLHWEYETTRIYVYSVILICLSIVSGFFAYIIGKSTKDSDIVEREKFVPGKSKTTVTIMREKITGRREYFYNTEKTDGFWIKYYKQILQTAEDKLKYLRLYIIASITEFFFLAFKGSKSLTNFTNFLNIKKFVDCFENHEINEIFINYDKNNYLHINLFGGIVLCNLLLFTINSIFFFCCIKNVVTCTQIFKGFKSDITQTR